MTHTLDIFKIEKDGTLVWKGTAENLEVAKLSSRGVCKSKRKARCNPRGGSRLRGALDG
jgi:hypothetical protein